MRYKYMSNTETLFKKKMALFKGRLLEGMLLDF